MPAITRFTAAFALFMSALLAAPHTAKAADSASKVTILHTPTPSKEIPSVGTQILLSANLKNSRDLYLDMKAYAVRDGKLMELAPGKSYVNEYDEATYEFTAYAPVAELSYQFLLKTKEGAYIASPRYTLRRECLPRVELIDTGDIEKAEQKERSIVRARIAEDLEKEIATYEHALKLLEELRDMKGGS